MKNVAEEFLQFENHHKPNLEETKTMNLGNQDCVNEVIISVQLNETQIKNLIYLLTEYIDVFVYEVSDMLGCDVSQATDQSEVQSSETEGLKVQA